MNIDVTRCQSLCADLERQIEAAFATATFEATACEVGRRWDAAMDLRMLLESMGRVGPDTAYQIER